MQQIFEFASYRKYLSEWIKNQGKKSYGLKGRIADALGISSSLFSQILKEEKSLTPDQASDLVDFIGLNEIEADYFLLLVEIDRAGTPRYRDKLTKKIHNLQVQAKKIGKRIPEHKQLNDEQKSIYYSSWLYAGVRNLTALDEIQNADDIAKHLQIDKRLVHRIVHFLLENGLCKLSENGLDYGSAFIYIDKDSAFINKHHQNWRLKAMQTMEMREDSNLFFTCPLSLSEKAYEEILKQIPAIIQSLLAISGPSKSEQTACLNIDLFKY